MATVKVIENDCTTFTNYFILRITFRGYTKNLKIMIQSAVFKHQIH